MSIARFNAPAVADITPLAGALVGLGERRRGREALAEEQELIGQALENDESLARLASLNPQAANVVGGIVERRDAEAANQLTQETERIAREAHMLAGLSGAEQDRAILRFAQEAAQRPGADLSSYQSLLDMSPEDRAIELQRDIIAATDIKTITERHFSGEEGFTLKPGDVRFDADGNVVASVDDPDVELREQELQLDRDKFNAEQAKTGLPDDDEAFDRAGKLRGEFIKVTADFAKQNESFGRIQASAEDPSAAGDLALIFNYMKLLDPGSTVREGEFANAQNAGGVDDTTRAWFNRIQRGERLSKNQRKDFVARSGKLFKKAQEQHRKREFNFRRLAKTAKVDPNLVVFNRNVVVPSPVEDKPLSEMSTEELEALANGG